MISFVPVCVVVLTIAHLATFYFILMNILNVVTRVTQLSSRTKALQRQFTRNLIVQVSKSLLKRRHAFGGSLRHVSCLLVGATRPM